MVAYDPRLESLAAATRYPAASGRLSVEKTSKELHVPLRKADLGDYVDAVTLRGMIVLNTACSSPGRTRFSFAHELGHLLIERGHMPWAESRTEERWADWFAHELVFPKRWLREQRWEQLRLFTDPSERRTIAFQLASSASSASSPVVLRAGDAVVCGRCGDRQLFDDCYCEEFRRDVTAAHDLPTLVNPEQMQIRMFARPNPGDALWEHLTDVAPASDA